MICISIIYITNIMSVIGKYKIDSFSLGLCHGSSYKSLNLEYCLQKKLCRHTLHFFTRT